MRTTCVVRAAANKRVCGVAGMVAITYARGKGGARSVGAGRGWRSGARSAWSGRGLCAWSRAWQRSRLGQAVAVDGGLPPRQGWHG